MFEDTLLLPTLHWSRWALQRRRRQLERAMEHGWHIEASRQLDACIQLEESIAHFARNERGAGI